jgi:hypothetical protein
VESRYKKSKIEDDLNQSGTFIMDRTSLLLMLLGNWVILTRVGYRIGAGSYYQYLKFFKNKLEWHIDGILREFDGKDLKACQSTSNPLLKGLV